MAVSIDLDACLGCGCCPEVCAYGALELSGEKARVNINDCTECKSCIAICPVTAITLPEL